MRYHDTSTNMAKTEKNKQIENNWQGCEATGTLTCFYWKRKEQQPP